MYRCGRVRWRCGQYRFSFYRLDSTLGDFTEMQWSRGDISFVYNGEDGRSDRTLSVTALDNKKKLFQRLSLASGVRGWVGVARECYIIVDNYDGTGRC